jgi:hypothetical protein
MSGNSVASVAACAAPEWGDLCAATRVVGMAGRPTPDSADQRTFFAPSSVALGEQL